MPDDGGQHRPVGVANLTGRRLLVGLDQFVAGWQDGYGRPRHDFDLRPADLGQESNFDRPQTRFAAQHDLARTHRASAAEDVAAGADVGIAEQDHIAAATIAHDLAPLNHHDGVLRLAGSGHRS